SRGPSAPGTRRAPAAASGRRWRARRRSLRYEERHVVLVAVEPLLARLERADDGVARRAVVRGRVLVGARVAAADLAPLRAAAQVHPRGADRQAVLAAGDAVAALRG